MSKQKLRKMMGNLNDPGVQSLVQLMETQSKITLARWALDYAQAHMLPIYAKAYPGDQRPEAALIAARKWLAGEIKLPEAKGVILNECHAAAREAEAHPAAQAAARACGQAASVIHAPTHSLGLYFYGAAAGAYDQLGIEESPEAYEAFAREECARLGAALREIAMEDEPNPAKLNWQC